jgi:hypothetical protein
MQTANRAGMYAVGALWGFRTRQELLANGAGALVERPMDVMDMFEVKNMNPRIKSVIAKDDYTLELAFTNGEHGIYDCSHLLDFGVFKELRDNRYFKSAKVLHGTVVWPHEQDICPDTLYLESKKKTPSQN